MKTISTIIAAASLLARLAHANICHEKVQTIPSGWQKLPDTLDPAEKYSFSIALHQPSMSKLESVVHSAANNPLSRDETRALRAPAPKDLDAVMHWLSSNCITDAKHRDGLVRVQTNVGTAEKLLRMKLNRYAYGNKIRVLRTQEYFIPDELSRAITFVHPITNFMMPQHGVLNARPLSDEQLLNERDIGPRDDAPCARVATPGCIRKLYNIKFDSSNKDSQSRIAVAGFLEEWANYNDSQTFLKRTAASISAVGYNFTTELINGGKNSQNPANAGVEAALDIDYSLALAYPSNISFVSTGGRAVKLDPQGKPIHGDEADNEPYLNLIDHLLSKPDDQLPHVLSISYADDELSIPRHYANVVCHMMGALTARGTTIIGGSGDGGSRGGGDDSQCRTHDGRDIAMVTFPSTCQWVTSVGATEGLKEPPNGAVFSTGGFSQYYPRPSWQDASVNGYLKQIGGLLNGKYKRNMRAVPDISALGTSFMIIINGQATAVDGTSASTPVIASLIALVNDARLKAGKKPIGWINKLLYSDKVKAVLQDIKGGTSKSCKFKDGSEPGGWPAKKGWDAITGLGVPKDFEAFKKVLVEA